MRPKKNLIEAAITNGSMNRLNMLLSAAHLLNCEANNLIEKASEVMAVKSLLLGDLKKLHTDFIKCADPYFREFATMVDTDKSKMDMFRDFESFDESFRKKAKINAEWKPSSKSGKKELK